MRTKEKIQNLYKDFKELKKGEKALIIVIVLVWSIVVATSSIQLYQLLKNTERWTFILLTILGFYEIPLLYQFTKWISAKEKEINRIMNKRKFVKDPMGALQNYEFVTVPEIIWGTFLEKSSVTILLFVNSLLLLAHDDKAAKQLEAYFSFIILTLILEFAFKVIYITYSANTCVIFTNKFRNKKIKSIFEKQCSQNNTHFNRSYNTVIKKRTKNENKRFGNR